MAKPDSSDAKTATLQLIMPGREPRNVGVFVLDVQTNKLHWRLVPDWQGYADQENIEVLELLDETLRIQSEQLGGTRLLASIEDTWSNTLQLSDEQDAHVYDYQAEIATLFRERVAAK